MGIVIPILPTVILFHRYCSSLCNTSFTAGVAHCAPLIHEPPIFGAPIAAFSNTPTEPLLIIRLTMRSRSRSRDRRFHILPTIQECTALESSVTKHYAVESSVRERTFPLKPQVGKVHWQCQDTVTVAPIVRLLRAAAKCLHQRIAGTVETSLTGPMIAAFLAMVPVLMARHTALSLSDKTNSLRYVMVLLSLRVALGK